MEIPEQPTTTPRKPSPGRTPKRPKVIAEGNGDGELMEPPFEEERFYDYLAALTTDFLVKNFAEPRLRVLCQNLNDTLDRARKRLQFVEQARTALLCTHCQKPLPNGRFAGEIVIRDELTNELVALRACSEPCYREVSRIANDRRIKHQGSIRGTIAF